MHQQCICDALSTEAIVCRIDDPAEDRKLDMHDFVVMVERVAVTLSVCGLIHAVM